MKSRVSLVGPLMPHFILLLEVNLSTVIILARVVTNLGEVYFLGFLAEMVITG